MARSDGTSAMSETSAWTRLECNVFQKIETNLLHFAYDFDGNGSNAIRARPARATIRCLLHVFSIFTVPLLLATSGANSMGDICLFVYLSSNFFPNATPATIFLRFSGNFAHIISVSNVYRTLKFKKKIVSKCRKSVANFDSLWNRSSCSLFPHKTIQVPWTHLRPLQFSSLRPYILYMLLA